MKLLQFSSWTAACIMVSTVTVSSCCSLRRELFKRSILEAPAVDFQSDWIHDFDIQVDLQSIDDVVTELRPPNFVTTFDFVVGSNSTASIQRLALQAKRNILQDSTGTVLFRGLNKAIHNVSDFSEFWFAMQWSPVEHVSCYNRKRESASKGVDFVDTDVPGMVLGPHNEHACNPNPTGRIAFYGFQPATRGGGESLVRHNSAIQVPNYVVDFVRKHGGIQTTRVYADHDRMLRDTSRHPTSMSWQERWETNSKQECKNFFAIRGMNSTKFDENGILTVTSVHPGWLDGSWFNHVEYGFPTQCADGTEFPRGWQMEMKKHKWVETFAYKLQEGDWLVLDNRSVQHGRLPYAGKRRLIVTYTD